MARNRQTAWRVEGYRQEIRDHGGLLAETRGQEGTAFPDRRVFRHGGFVAVRGRAHVYFVKLRWTCSALNLNTVGGWSLVLLFVWFIS